MWPSMEEDFEVSYAQERTSVVDKSSSHGNDTKAQGSGGNDPKTKLFNS